MAVAKVLSERELATELGLPYTTVRNMRLKEKCPHFTVGHRIFYRLESVLAWMDKQEQANEQQPQEQEYGTLRMIR